MFDASDDDSGQANIEFEGFSSQEVEDAENTARAAPGPEIDLTDSDNDSDHDSDDERSTDYDSPSH